MHDIKDFLVGLSIVVVFLGVLWAVAHFVGSNLGPIIKHHPQENADCYTATRMFFVSIACVEKPS